MPVNAIIRFGDHVREFMKLESSAGLAYEEYGEGYGVSDRLAILVGAGVAGPAGYLVLRAAGRKSEEREGAVGPG